MTQPNSHATVVKTFFEGKDLRVVLRLFDRDPDLLITFTGRAASPPVPTGFGEQFFLKRGLSAIHFISKANHWWQTAEVDEAIGALRSGGILDGKRQITLYGSSMGGYAVLMQSMKLRPTQVLAVSPQYSIDGKVVPFERRWRAYAAKLKFDFDNMAAGLDPFARVLVIVDSFFEPDAQHLRLIQKHRPVEVVRISFAGHNTARALAEIGLATRLVTEVVKGAFDHLAYTRDYRRIRAASCLFWYGLAEYLAERGRRAWAFAAATLAAHLMVLGGRMRDHGLQRDLLTLALELACEAGARSLARRWLAELERHLASTQSLLVLRGKVAIACRENDRAMEIMRELLKTGAGKEQQAFVLGVLNDTGRFRKARGMLKQAAASTSLPVLLTAGRAWLENDRAEEAIPLLGRALALAPRSAEARILLAAGQLACGQREAAAATLGAARFASPLSPVLAKKLVGLVAELHGEKAGRETRRGLDRMVVRLDALASGLDRLNANFADADVRRLLHQTLGLVGR